MTRTARVMAAVEAVIPDFAAAGKLIAEHPMDIVLREVLFWTYDPFLVWELNEPLPPISNPEAADAALMSEWESFTSQLLVAARTAVPGVLAPFRSSPAWPIYARVVSKRFVDVPFVVANQWGTLPVFRGAPIAETMEESVEPWRPGTLVRVPLHARRCFTLVRSPFTLPSAYFLDLCGNPIPTVDHAAVRARIESRDAWRDLEAEASEYEDGLVVDGWLMTERVQAPYTILRAFDVVPLRVFATQQRSRPYVSRFEDLLHTPVKLAPLVSNASAEDRARLLEEPGALFVIDQESAYPFTSPSPWRWVRKGKVRFD